MSFIPSHIQKRLLRFVITKLDIIDADSLNLDQLDIAWGMRSSFELRDLKLNVKTLCRICHLPAAFESTHGTISSVKITIPADLFSSGIRVQIDGVEVGLRHITSKSKDVPSLSDSILNTKDVAKEFLAAEPEEEIHELEEAIHAHPEMEESAYLDDSSEEETGMGGDIGLPSLFAGMIQGIGNRAELSIKNVIFSLCFDLPTEEFDIPKNEVSESYFKFYAEDLEIEGLTTMKPIEDDDVVGKGLKDKRRLLCKKMRADLTTTSAFFATLSRVSSMPSNAESHQTSPASSQKTKSPTSTRSSAASPPAPGSSSRLQRTVASSRGLVTSRDFGASSMADSRRSGPLLDASTHSEAQSEREDDRFADASDDGHGDQPEQFPSHQSFGFHRRQRDDHDRFEDSEEDSGHEQPFPMDIEPSEMYDSHASHASDSSNNSSQLPSIASLARRTDEKMLGSSGQLQASSSRSPFVRPRNLGLSIRSTALSHSDSPEYESSDDGDAGLNESMLFSTEDARSMYQSAMSTMQRSVISEKEEEIDSDDEHLAYGTGVPIPAALTEPDRTDDGLSATPKGIIPPNASASSPKTPRAPVAPGAGSDQLTTKTVFFLDYLSIGVPWLGDHRPEESDHLSDVSTEGQVEQSVHPMPGAFSYHEKVYNSGKGKQRATEPKIEQKGPKPAGETDPAPEIEIRLGFLDSQFDLSTGRLLYLLFEQVVGASKDASSDPPSPKTLPLASANAPEAEGISVKFSLERFQVKVMQSLRDNFGWGPLITAVPTEPLVVLDLAGCEAQYAKKTGQEMARLAINKFSLGLPNEKIISFTDEVPTSEASQVLPPPHDILLKYGKSLARGTEMNIATRHLVLSLDMQKLDDRLECYGGLSAVLDLSSSIASNGTVLPQKNLESLPSTTLAKAPLDDSMAVKANARISGITFRIKGRVHGIELKSTALKVAVRNDVVRATVSHIQIQGPVAEKRSLINDTVSIDVTKIEVFFLFSTTEDEITKLLSLITPSRDPYDDEDDILVDTLIKQRKHASVVKGKIDSIDINISDMTALTKLQALGDELSKLQNVAKYLPEDDRPGIMALITVDSMGIYCSVNRAIGAIDLRLHGVTLAHVAMPQLSAFQVASLSLQRNRNELMHPLLPFMEGDELPMLMGKFIPDEMEPTAKIKIFNLAVQYDVETLMEILDTADRITHEDLTASMVASVSTVRGVMTNQLINRQHTWSSDGSTKPKKPLKLSILLRDCACLLNPVEQTSQGIFLLGEAHLSGNLAPKDTAKGQFDLRSASILAIDDADAVRSDIQPASRHPTLRVSNPAVSDLTKQGYQLLGTISQTKVDLTVDENPQGKPKVEAIVNSHLVVLETCADSTQTLIKMMDGLKPPSAPDPSPRYLTEPMNPEDLMKAFTGNTFEEDEDDLVSPSQTLDEEELDQISDEFEMVGSFYNPSESEDEFSGDRLMSRRFTLTEEPSPSATPPFSDPSKLAFRRAAGDEPFQFVEDHIKSLQEERTVYGWNSNSKRYGNVPVKVKDCPIRLEIRSETFIWNLFDGYDWQNTRNVISEAVEEVAERAAQRRMTRQRQIYDDNEEESEIGDFLFQSIWIAVPPNKDENDLRRHINREMDMRSEAGTTTTAYSAASSRATARGKKGRSLKLERSSRQKVSIQIQNLKAEILGLPPNVAETQTSINVHVGDFEIFDHVPTSTWRKFMTYQHDAGMRPTDKPMIHLDLQIVKTNPELAATEFVIKVTVLPLRLHVDQDTLDFITRFFEFKDTTTPEGPPSEPPFIQRCEVKAVNIRLDYKPKKVDYLGLRSGKTKEFMNFIGLDDATIVLQRLILYGISGFDRLHHDLNDIWVGDVVRNQIPIVVTGLAPVRPIANVGSAIRQLVMVPMEEYRKDGRVIRSVHKGATAFARKATSEIARLGAKVAIGTSNLIEGAGTLLTVDAANTEEYYSGDESSARRRPRPSLHTRSPSTASGRAISHYANQPLTIAAGLRSAARVLERDLVSAQDAIIAVGTEIRDSETAAEVLGAVVRSAPAVILRPAVGATRAFGTALLGVGNAFDADSKRKLEDKYK